MRLRDMVHHFLQLAAFEIINDDLLKPGLFLLTSSLCLPTGLLLERKILQMIFVEIKIKLSKTEAEGQGWWTGGIPSYAHHFSIAGYLRND
jgi:hypothetical protein